MTTGRINQVTNIFAPDLANVLQTLVKKNTTRTQTVKAVVCPDETRYEKHSLVEYKSRTKLMILTFRARDKYLPFTPKLIGHYSLIK